MREEQQKGFIGLVSLSANDDSLSINDDEALALARATVNLAKVWRLTDFEACALLGGMPPHLGALEERLPWSDPSGPSD